jgi:hypothetical protein
LNATTGAGPTLDGDTSVGEGEGAA